MEYKVELNGCPLLIDQLARHSTTTISKYWVIGDWREIFGSHLNILSLRHLMLCPTERPLRICSILQKSKIAWVFAPQMKSSMVYQGVADGFDLRGSGRE